MIILCYATFLLRLEQDSPVRNKLHFMLVIPEIPLPQEKHISKWLRNFILSQDLFQDLSFSQDPMRFQRHWSRVSFSIAETDKQGDDIWSLVRGYLGDKVKMLEQDACYFYGIRI